MYCNQEISLLRKQGEPEKAIEKAKDCLKRNPEDLWVRKAVSWAYYDLAKKAKENNNFDDFIRQIDEILELNLPENESMIRENVSKLINGWIFNWAKNKHYPWDKINQLLKRTQKLELPKPGEAYSYVLKAYLKIFKENPLKSVEFIDWWDLKNLRIGDFEQPVFEGGKKGISLAERAYITYAKSLLNNTNLFSEKARDLLQTLDELIKKHPDMKYMPYYKAKILLELGNKKAFLENFIPFLKKNRNTFWVWDLLAEATENPEQKLSYLSKSILLNKSIDHSVKTRRNIIPLLINKGLYDAAKTEVLNVLETYKKNNWKIPRELILWQNERWFHQAKRQKSNIYLYNNLAESADNIFFENIKPEKILVTYVNKDKNLISFLKGKPDNLEAGFFPYNPKINSVNKHDILEVKLQNKSGSNFYQARILRTVSPEEPFSLRKNFEGKLRLHYKGFGFVDNVFIPSFLIQHTSLQNGQQVKGTAVLSYDMKKKKYGWSAIECKVALNDDDCIFPF